ncbi:purine nucleoside permease [Novosphingobium sp. 1949]|uniref:Purine nucleoside permease n=1 Tax=Novosphingobium organovorum TaxID=2930092 RepID=A0ABT0BH99_9SPHN|nr:purine nucleoside permease [Novosphingobium organovorum]MCJ2184436.1 purine nucleoside permease [Novosphingobium organovorum]
MRTFSRPGVSLTGLATALCGALALSAAPAQADSASDAAAAQIAACKPAQPCAHPLPVKVVIVSLFEIGADEGDTAGEFQLWKERRGLTMRIPFPQSFHDLYYNPETQVLAMVTGVGTAKSSAATMALGLDPRFDLAHSYWIVAGIAGIDPHDATIGSVAFARYAVDGDLAHEIDPREIPKDWKYGYFPRGTQGPNDTTTKVEPSGELFTINPSLERWAFNLTKTITLPDRPEIAKERLTFTGYPNAQKPPVVMEGDTLSAMTFWHGKRMTDWANDWVKYWTKGKGEFVTSAMEDTGVMQAMTYLDAAGRADRDRVLVIRAGSNFTMPPPGTDAASYLLRENEGYAGLEAAVENVYTVGSAVVDELLAHWDKYETTTP